MNMMKDAAQAFFWLSLAVGVVAGLVWRHRRKSKSDLRDFKRGEEEAKRLLEAGVFPMAILSYIDVQRSRGMSGPYEMGLKKALSKASIK